MKIAFSSEWLGSIGLLELLELPTSPGLLLLFVAIYLIVFGLPAVGGLLAVAARKPLQIFLLILLNFSYYPIYLYLLLTVSTRT
jgi:hypothetical protein